MARNGKATVWTAVSIALGAVFIGACVALALTTRGCEQNYDDYKNPETMTAASGETADETTAEEPLLPENPIKFGELRADYPDAVAWIKVPGTPIDYPVVCSDESELYYLRRDAAGGYSISGCIFMQGLNERDFSDPNTVIYGHYMPDGSFFGALHNFRDRSFFDENTEITVYIPGHVLTYEIFAAYEYDSRHILKSFNMHDPEVFEEYLNSCLHPTSIEPNVREGVTLTRDDRIITLSTCLESGADNKRFLVQGVLRNDEATR